jgi:hypothetical protein
MQLPPGPKNDRKMAENHHFGMIFWVKSGGSAQNW